MFDIKELSALIELRKSGGGIVWEETPPTLDDLLYGADEKLTIEQRTVLEEFYGTDPKNVFNNDKNFLFLAFGKGSGKDFMAVRLVAWGVAILYCMYDPRLFFNLSTDATIDIINVSKTSEQAANIFFSRLIEYIEKHPWFRKRFQIYRRGAIVHRNPKGVPLRVIDSKGLIKIPSKGILAISANAQYGNYEGYSPIMVVIDELGNFYQAPEGKTSPQDGIKVFDTLLTSARTRYIRNFKVIAISWIRGEDDCMMQLMESYKDNPRAILKFKSLWEVRPELFSGEMFDLEFRGSIYKIPIELKEDFKRDVALKLRMLASIVLPSGKTLFNDSTLFESFFVNEKPIFEIYDYLDKDLQGSHYRVKKKIMAINRVYRDKPLFIHTDLGEVNCPAVVTIGYGILKDRVSNERSLKVIGSYAWIPESDKGILVSINNIIEFILEIAKTHKVQMIQYDRWNSASSIEAFESQGLFARRHNISRIDYLMYKNMMASGNVKSVKPGYDIMAQFKGIVDNGKRIDRKKGHYKDGVDGFVGLATLVRDAEIWQLDERGHHRAIESRQLGPRVDRISSKLMDM